MLFSMAAISVIFFGDGDDIVRRLSGVVTIGCFGFMLVYQTARIVTGKQPFTCKPAKGNLTALEFLPMVVGLGALGLHPFWPELNRTAIFHVGFAPLIIGSLHRLLVLRDW